MKRKIVTMLLTLSLVCGCLAGCGGNGDKQNGGKTDPNGTDTEGTTELTLWCSYTEASTAVLKEMVEKFNEEQQGKYHMSVENAGSVNQFRTKLATMKQSDYPSVFFGIPQAIYEYSTEPYTVPIQKYLDEDSDKWTDDMYENVKAAYSDENGNLIGTPLGLSTRGYMVNVTALEAAGYKLTDITSFEKLAEASQKAVDQGAVKYGYCVGDGSDIYDMLLYQGVDLFDGENGRNGEVTKSMYTEEETHAALKKLLGMWAKLWESGASYKNASGTQGGQSLFVNGSLMFWTCTNSFVYELSDMKLNFEWAFLPHVGVDENAKYKGNALVEGTGLFIANTGNETEMQGAYEFIKFAARTDNQVFWATYRGYVPYTNEAAASEEWAAYQRDVFPSSVRLIEMLQSTPADLRLPYCKLTSQIMAVNADINSYVMADPTGNLDTYIQDAADSINESIQILKMRGQ